MTDQQPRQPRQEPQREQPPRTNAFLRYSGMAIQMGLTIGIAVWGGIKLDEKFPNKAHAWTLSLSIVGVVVAMYMVIRDLLKKK